MKKLKKKFGNVPNTLDIPVVKTIEPEQDGARRVMVHKESEVEMLAISFPIPNFQHADQVKLSALSEMLSSGKSSRLYRTLVDEKRLVNQIYAYNMENADAGVFLFVAVCNNGIKAETAEEEIWKIIHSLQSAPVEKAELDKVKINTKSDFIYSLESSTSVADLFGSYLARGDISPLMSYESSIEALKPEDIQTVAKHYLIPEKSTTIILRKGQK